MAAARRGTSGLEAAPAFSSTPVCTPCCHHTPSPYPPPVTLSLLPPAAFPCPQSPILLSLLAIPEAAQLCHCLLSFYSPHITSFTLTLSSLTLSFKLLGFPDPVWMYPYSPPCTNQFCQTDQHLSPPEDKSCSQPFNHPQVAASTLLFKGDLEKTSRCQQISVLQRFLIMYLPLPFSCPAVGKVAEHLVLWPIVCPLLRGGVGHGVVLAVGAEPWQEKINEVERAGTHDWCQ